jgi:aspartyl-tRNA(Asn)/glutamyl-tRNA(Gln) amidotransferase subunit C
MINKTLTREEIIHLAGLANLKLTDEEIEKYRHQLSQTLDYVNNLNELKTEDVKVTCNTTSLTDIFFEDGSANKRNLGKDGYFKVERILPDNVYDE